jgi:DNA-directed RNA polymerase subunit K/omega
MDDSDIEAFSADELDIADEEYGREVAEAVESEDEAEIELIKAEDVPGGHDDDDDEEESTPDTSYAPEAEADPLPKPGAYGPRDDRVMILDRETAELSRMPDIPSLYELTGMIISRATSIANNSPPLIKWITFDPAQIARDELIAGKSMRSVLRDGVEWKWKHFACFPLGFMDTHSTVANLHTVT